LEVVLFPDNDMAVIGYYPVLIFVVLKLIASFKGENIFGFLPLRNTSSRSKSGEKFSPSSSSIIIIGFRDIILSVSGVGLFIVAD
jgi:hypothetical protein